MKKKTLYLGIAVILTAAMALSACKEEEEEYGLLTIKNLPSQDWIGSVYYDEDNIKSLEELRYYTGSTTHANTVAEFENPDGSYSDRSPYSLYDRKNYTGFTKSGVFLVCICRQPVSSNEPYYAFMSGVTFRDGKATIDYNDMTKYDGNGNKL